MMIILSQRDNADIAHARFQLNDLLDSGDISSDQKSKMPSPIRENFDYDVIPNWIDRVGIEENKRKERKSRIDIILKRAFSENIKFWISPDGRFYGWSVSSYDSAPHHNQKLKEFAPGYFEGNKSETAVALAVYDGWVDGGNINGIFYIRTEIFRAQEYLIHVPSEYRKADKLSFEGWGNSIDTWGQDVLGVLNKVLREREQIKSHITRNKMEIISQREQPSLIMTVGITGAGKSRWIQSLPKDEYVIVSPDDIRQELTGNMSDQTQNGKVWFLTKQRTIDALKASKSVILDATNVDRKNRKNFIQGLPADIKLKAKIFEVDPEIAKERIRKQIERGENRSNVPPHVTDNMYQKFKSQSQPNHLEEEGFEIIK